MLPTAALRQRLEGQLAASLPTSPELVLVTDLDGTLLGGSAASRRRFYAWLVARRQQVLHVFCTGRDLRSVARLLDEEDRLGLHPPHLVIGDVGCTVACGLSLAPLPLVVDPIERRWQGLPERLLPLIAEAGVHAVANPLINITLQGRYDSYPKRRGMTRVPELMDAGVTVAFGHDCVMDPWYALGSADMLEVASMGLHVAQMTSQAAQQRCFEAVTTNPARILGLQGYGLEVGCRADGVLLQARSPQEAIRLRAQRLLVLRGGQVLSRMAPAAAQLSLPGRPQVVDFTRQTPATSQTPPR
jgi:hypothetical protein